MKFEDSVLKMAQDAGLNDTIAKIKITPIGSNFRVELQLTDPELLRQQNLQEGLIEITTAVGRDKVSVSLINEDTIKYEGPEEELNYLFNDIPQGLEETAEEKSYFYLLQMAFAEIISSNYTQTEQTTDDDHELINKVKVAPPTQNLKSALKKGHSYEEKEKPKLSWGHQHSKPLLRTKFFEYKEYETGPEQSNPITDKTKETGASAKIKIIPVESIKCLNLLIKLADLDQVTEITQDSGNFHIACTDKDINPIIVHVLRESLKVKANWSKIRDHSNGVTIEEGDKTLFDERTFNLFYSNYLNANANQYSAKL